MKHFITIITFFMLTISAASAQELLEIAVSNLKYHRAETELFGQGTLIAKSFKIDIEQFNFEINQQHELFKANLYFDNNILQIKSANVNMAIELGVQEDLWKLRQVDLKNGEFLYHTDRFSVGGEAFTFNLDGILFNIINSRINCDLYQHSPEIDLNGIVKNCLNHSHLDAQFINSGESSSISIQDLKSKNTYQISSKLKKLQINPKTFYLLSPESKYKDNSNEITFKNLSASCNKIEFTDQIDPQMLIQGCFEKSDLSMSNLAIKNKIVDIDVVLESFQLAGADFKFRSPNAVAKNNDGTHIIQQLFVSCKKQSNFKSLTIWTILKNCFEKSLNSISRIKLHQRSVDSFIEDIKEDNPILSRQIEDMERGFDEMKDISLTFNQNNFDLILKLEFLKLNIPGKVKGRVSLHEKEGEIRIIVDSGKLMGVPMKKIFFHFLKKIFKTEFIKIKGDLITIKVP